MKSCGYYTINIINVSKIAMDIMAEIDFIIERKLWVKVEQITKSQVDFGFNLAQFFVTNNYLRAKINLFTSSQ